MPMRSPRPEGAGIKELTRRELIFCEKYLGLGDSGLGQAAIVAGYAKTNSRARGFELLSRPHIDRYIRKRRDEIMKETQVDLNYVMHKLKYVTDTFIPDDKQLKKDEVPIGLSALKEINAIQGNYAAEKRITMTLDGDKHIEELKRTMTEQAILEYKQPF